MEFLPHDVRSYIQQAGFDPAQDALVQAVAHHVDDFPERTASNSSPLEEEQLYVYEIPIASSNESCSVPDAPVGPKTKIYNLAGVLGGRKASTPRKLAVLKELVRHATQITAVNWLGIYQARTKADGERVLVKLAYQGALSLPEFPLTPEWAARSNNSAVGLSGTARVINDVRAYVRAGGSYYTCDPKVLAEACLPLFTSGSREVIGIIDAEAWRKDFFTDDTLARLLALCVLVPEWLP